MHESEHDDLIGSLLDGRYRVIRSLDKGAMGVVYEGIQEHLKKSVAIKVVAPKLITRPERLRRFRREAEVLAALSHPNIAHAIDFFIHDDRPIYVMELVKGPSLAKVLKKERRLSPSRISHIASQVLFALESTSEAQIVHRDLKPSNIMLAQIPGLDEWVKVVDFGIALIREETGVTRLTQTGQVLGTPNYMAPEQLMGKNVDMRADLYSLGAVMFRALSGRTPYSVANFKDLCEALRERPVPTVEDLEPYAPTALCHVVIRALSKEPNDRFETPRVMAIALKRAAVQNQRELSPDVMRCNEQGGEVASATGVTVDLKMQRRPSSPGKVRTSDPEYDLDAEQENGGYCARSENVTPDYKERSQTQSGIQRRRSPLAMISALLIGAVGAALLVGIIAGAFAWWFLRNEQSTTQSHLGDVIEQPVPRSKSYQPSQAHVFHKSPPVFPHGVSSLPTWTSPPSESVSNDKTMKIYLASATSVIEKLIPGYTPRLTRIDGYGVDPNGKIRIDTIYSPMHSTHKRWSFGFCNETSGETIFLNYYATRENPASVIATKFVQRWPGLICNQHLGPIDTLPDSDEVMQFYLKSKGCNMAVYGDVVTISYYNFMGKTVLVTGNYDNASKAHFQAHIEKAGELAIRQDCEGNIYGGTR